MNMVHIWYWLFLPATGLTGLGVMLLAVSAVPADGGAPLQITAWELLGMAILISSVLALWVSWHRPNLGASD